MIPQDPMIDEMEGRGLVAALLFVDEHCERWPALDAIQEIHRLIFRRFFRKSDGLGLFRALSPGNQPAFLRRNSV